MSFTNRLSVICLLINIFLIYKINNNTIFFIKTGVIFEGYSYRPVPWNFDKWPGAWENVPRDMCIHGDCADQCHRCPHEETLHSWLTKICSVKVQIRLHECAGRSGPALPTNCMMVLFMLCASYERCFYVLVFNYSIKPKYSDTSKPGHTSPQRKKVRLTNCWLNNCWMSVKQCRTWSNAAFCDVWSWSTVIAQDCLSEYCNGTPPPGWVNNWITVGRSGAMMVLQWINVDSTWAVLNALGKWIDSQPLLPFLNLFIFP